MAVTYAELKVCIGYVCSVTLTHNMQISNHATEMLSARRKNTEIKIQTKMCGLIKGRATETAEETVFRQLGQHCADSE